ncbi:MAG TPA: outer membrane beta-barrel protein [Chitinophagaceae bacterium]|nr:outer membrane beta-barrel protein [Chitinophagaceae bacterium]
MRKLVLLVLLGFTGFTSFGQANGTIKGKITDSIAKQVLTDATVSVLLSKDSTPVTFTIVDNKGNFNIKNLDTGLYRLLVTFQGYSPFSKTFMISKDFKDVDFGTIYMDKQSVMLDEVVVERPPIAVKKDTVEFSAGSFKTKPNASAEDLLKKLPGVQVDKDGNVKAQGEDIPKVYVDGKEFFGNDPKLATKNITADMIESVQVFDDMSDQAKFSRIDDGSRTKAINFKLKKDKRKGYFGKGVAGIGTDGRYEGSLSFNRFNGDRRISVLGGINNLNKQAFSFSDIVSNMGGFGARAAGGGGGGGMVMMGGGMRMGGGMPSFGGGGNGITRNLSAGLNFSDKWKKMDVTGSYFYSNSDNRSERSSLRQSFFSNDSVTYQDLFSVSRTQNQNHRFNLRMEYYIDSMNSILYTPTFTVQHSENESRDTIATRAVKPGLDFLALNGVTRNRSERDGLNLNNNLLYRHKFHKPGRTFTLGLNSSINRSEGEGINFAPYTFYNPDSSVARVSNQDLKSFQDTRSNNVVVSSSYTEPIGRNKILEVNYAYTDNHSKSDRRAFDFNPGSGLYDKVNPTQTNYFETDYLSHRMGANFRVQATKYNFQLGMGMQLSELTNFSRRKRANNTDTVSHTSQDFKNFFPTANFTYNFAKSKTLRVNYRGRTNQPSISQLQDVPDFSDPLYVRTGNPELKQEFNNNISINYNSFNPANFRFLAANIRYDQTSNKIVNSIDTLGRGVQIQRPVNMNGAFSTGSFVTLGFPLRGKWKGSNFNLSNSVNYNRDINLLNKQKNVLNNFTVTQSVGINLDVKQKLNVGANASLTYNKATYSVQENLNTKFISQTYSIDASYITKSNTVISSDFDYYVNTGRADGFNQSLPLWNASIAQQLFKKKNGEIKFSVNDILNQNQSITRSVGDNYIVDTRTMVLQRYFMLTFTYNLNRAGAQPQRGNMMMPGGGGGMQRRMDRIN